jgi:hypothetical protein
MELASPIPEYAQQLAEAPGNTIQQISATHPLLMLDAILKRDWSTCQALSEDAISRGDHLLKTLRSDLLSNRDEIIETFRRFKYSGFLDLSPQDLAEHLEAQASSEDVKTQAGLKKAMLLHFKQLQEEFDDSLDNDIDVDIGIALMSHGLKCLCQSVFNQHYLALTNLQTIDEETISIDALSKPIDDMALFLNSEMLALYGDLLGGIKKRYYSQELYDRVRLLEVELPAFYEHMAHCSFLLKQAVTNEVVGRTNELGQLCARANDLAREAICIYIASLKLSFQILQFKPEKNFKTVLNKIHKLPFDCVLPNGKNIRINKMSSTEEGDFIEVSGVVKSVTQKDLSDGSLVSEVIVEDIGSGATVRAAIRYAHVSRMGIMPGAYINLHGQVNKNMTILDGEEGIRIDRIPHVTLASNCWRLSFLRLAEPWYPRWRHGLNMRWSVSPHLPISETPDELMQGANEIIYSPYLRAK